MKLKVFFSWQTETDSFGLKNKEFLIATIQRVLNEIQNKGQLRGITFEFHEGLRTEAGTPNVSNAMFKQIKDCDIFIGDLTITSPKPNSIQKFVNKIFNGAQPRRTINSNVLLETQTAFDKNETFYQQVILVMNDLFGIPKEEEKLIPFDIRPNRWPITFHLSKHMKGNKYKDKKFESTLAKALLDSSLKAIENIAIKYKPFISWKDQNSHNTFKGRFIWNDPLKGLKEILKGTGIIRLIGLSGLGKSFLVLESYEESQNHYLYCDYGTTNFKSLYDRLQIIFREYPEAVLIIDNCPSDVLEKIRDLRIAEHVHNHIITIFNDPNEASIDGTNQIILDFKKDENIVDEIINRITVKDEIQKSLLVKFAGGIPLMAQLLVQGFSDGKELGDISNERLINRLLGNEKNSEERVFLQSLSLFKFVGWEGEKRNQLKFIAKNKNITSVNITDEEVLLNKFDEVIKHNISRTIIEQRARMVGIRPLPLAQYLILEWFEKCTGERLLKVIKALQDPTCPSDLKYHLGEQFRFMGYSQQAVDFVNNVLGENSPFGNAEVINTEVGSHLFRMFVEVNLEAVANCLSRIILPMSSEELKKLKEGRRNIVWAVEKICFDPKTFFSGAKLMLRLAVAENERWSNNATGDFVSLFPIMLPATAADFKSRLYFLRENFEGEQMPMIFKALKRALYCRNFTFMSGPETQGLKKLDYYMPKGEGEIAIYIAGCLEILESALPQEVASVKDILEADALSICDIGLADKVLPLVRKVAEKLQYNWEEMRNNMSLLKDEIITHLSKTENEEFDEILRNLTKEDIVSVFSRIEKDSYKKTEGSYSFEKQQEWRKEQYTKLAKRFANSYDKTTLANIMSAQVSIVSPFGSKLYELLNDKDKIRFVNDSVDILNFSSKSYYSNILLDFFSNVSEEEFRKEYEDIIFTLKEKRIIFSIIGRIGFPPDSNEFKEIEELVKEDKASVKDFSQYWINWPFSKQDTNNVSLFFNKVLSFDGGYQLICRICSITSFKRLNDKEGKLTNIVKNAIIAQNDPNVLFKDNSSIQIILRMLKESSDMADLAKNVHQKLLKYVENGASLLNSDNNIRNLYDYLIDKYYGYIWDDLSQAIVKFDDIAFFDLKMSLGSLSHKQQKLFVAEHEKDIMALCDKYPDIAPSRIISILPTYNDDGSQLHPLILKLIDKYGDSQNVLDGVGYNIGTYSGVGSRIPYLRRQIKALETLKDNHFEEVRSWAALHINILGEEIKKEKLNEEEFNALHEDM